MEKRYKIPSKSEPNTYRYVVMRGKDDYWCSCPSMSKGDCSHIRLVKKHLGYIAGHHNYCWYTHDNRYLDEHHLMRASDRKHSLTVYLTRWVHEIATNNIHFDKHLQDLFFKTMNKRIREIKFRATIKEVVVRNLVSGDKGVSVKLHSDNINEAMKLAEIEPQDLVKISYESEDTPMQFYASVVRVKKENLKDADARADVVLSCAPAETINAVQFSVFPVDTIVGVEYKV